MSQRLIKIRDDNLGYRVLYKINSSKDVRGLSDSEIKELCVELRTKIVEVVSQNGGHLASNLGSVELTVALHRVFDLPDDKIIWDVGHQCYTHKILTGRKDQINTIRTENGLSGFPKRSESPCDAFDVGHSSTSISAALGISVANYLQDKGNYTVAVIGDGALTGGLAYEGLNNAGRIKKNFIVVLNDNKMSISRNVGSMSRYLTRIRMRPSYLKVKGKVEWALNHTPVIGKTIRSVLLKSKSAIRTVIYKSTLFEDMGFIYYGPIDGHDVKSLTKALEFAKKLNSPVLVHVITKKGKGYEFAEKNPKDFHGTPKFDVYTGKSKPSSGNFSSVFGEELCKLAEKDFRICAITAAMKIGTGLREFSKLYKKRFFDVGIAEEHAVTFAAGLASQGMLPVFAVYSTFLQRAYDQILHDAVTQKLNVVLAVDRAGIVGEDGETHQGVFDVSFLNAMPGVTILCPSFYSELRYMLEYAIYNIEGVKVIRYPRGTEPELPKGFVSLCGNFDLFGESSGEIAIVTYGRIFSDAYKVKKHLEDVQIKTSILKLNVVKPLDIESVKSVLNFKHIFFFEEGMLHGGISETFSCELLKNSFKGSFHPIAIDGKFITHSSVQSALHSLSLDYEGMLSTIKLECGI